MRRPLELGKRPPTLVHAAPESKSYTCSSSHPGLFMEAILLIFSVAGLAIGAAIARSIPPLVAGLAVLVATCVFGVVFWNIEFGGITFSLDRLLLVGVLLAAAWQWRLGQLDLKPLLWVDYLLLLFVAILTINAFCHDWRSVDALQHLINGYWIPLALYFLARQSRLDQWAIDALLVGLTCFGLYLGGIGWLETFGQWSLVFPRYIADPELGLHFGRARGPMIHSVSYGLYLCATATACWLWKEKVGKVFAGMLWTGLGVIVAAAYFTKTRTVWLGMAASALLTVGHTLAGRLRWAVLGLMLAAGVLLVVIKLDALAGLEREGTVQDTAQSTSMRASFAYVSYKMFLDRPLTGFGFGQFVNAKLPYLNDRKANLKLFQIRDYVHHNTFLSVLTDVGLLGFLPWLAMLVSWGWIGWQMIVRPHGPPYAKEAGILFVCVLAASVCQMIGHEITYTPVDHSLLYFVAGTAVGIYARLRTTAEPHVNSGQSSTPSTMPGVR